MKRNAFRDFFRTRRVRRHVARHGDRYDYHGIQVTVPASAGIGAASALLRGKYERAEAAMIARHLPAGRPVIELGGSLGVVSALIRSRLDPGMRHVVVEANPDILDICGSNARRGAGTDETELVHAAYFPGGGEATLLLGAEVHANALDDGSGAGRRVSVPAVSLDSLWSRIGRTEGFTLVSDIEGGETALFLQEPAMLDHVGLVIAEMHPDAYRGQGTSEAALLAVARAHGLVEIDRMDDTVVLARSADAALA
ncbi:hypothetical protein CSC94_21980 [Zhengella mangrovi]|uniref:Methyltransferase FkbM domain-containing protein n=1 Tax=Zhengella mangrovi TaxID=1982044 RepID=A0A2G1QI29_9HYPH|nr:hypothetical protein [Zhengella mangrovi]PHP64858.1 hypothetical protein CSC94_21980 [Zhengella mangrovi]